MVVLKRLMIWRWMIRGIVETPGFEIDVLYGLRLAIRSWFGNNKIIPSDLLRIANTWISNVTRTYQEARHEKSIFVRKDGVYGFVKRAFWYHNNYMSLS